VQKVLGIPVAMLTGVFPLARTVGWIAQRQEMITDPEYKIGRPRQLFSGPTIWTVVPINKRKKRNIGVRTWSGRGPEYWTCSGNAGAGRFSSPAPLRIY
jgi:hypothetical protein